MRLLLLAAKNHFLSYWSNQTNFWSGVLGMIVNNAITILGIWAMLFAGKSGYTQEQIFFFAMNFLLMVSYGCLHVFFGGITKLDQQINDGALDLVLMNPRDTIFTIGMTSSSLPAWGDIILGLVGLVALSFFTSILFLFHALLMISASFLATYAFYILVGSMAFFFRRIESASAVWVNIFLALNTYPVIDTNRYKWVLFFVPVLLAGMIPAQYLLQPSLAVFSAEILASVVFFLMARLIFWWGMRRYQSQAGLGLQRT